MTKGSCVCGNLTYEFTGEPEAYMSCRCIPCRKTSGATKSYNLLIPNGNINKTGGEFKHHTRKGDSGQDVTYWQCDKCSNIIWVRPTVLEGKTILKLGTIDDTDFLDKLGEPMTEIYCKNMIGWEKPVEGAVTKDTM